MRELKPPIYCTSLCKYGFQYEIYMCKKNDGFTKKLREKQWNVYELVINIGIFSCDDSEFNIIFPPSI